MTGTPFFTCSNQYCWTNLT